MNGAGKSDSGKKKALIVTTVSGFVPQFEINNVRILQELGYEVHYASNFRNPGYGNDNSRLAGTGIRCHQIDLERSPFRFHPALRAYRQLKALLEREHFELIHCHTPMGGAIGRLAAAAVNRGYQKCAAQKEKQEKQSGKSAGKRRCGKTTFCVKDENKRNTEESTSKRQISQSRVIYTAHGFHFYRGAPLINWLLYYPAERWLARYTDVLITINGEDYKRARRFCCGKKTKVERLIGAGADITFFRGDELPEGRRVKMREAMRKELHAAEDEIVFLSVGELIPRKNHSLAIKAFVEIENERLAEDRGAAGKVRHREGWKGQISSEAASKSEGGRFRYFICGKGAQREVLQRQIERAGMSGRIELLGYRKNIRAMLYAADVFVFPSLQEGMPMALIEAAAAGLPIIASDIRGNREVLSCCGDAEGFTGLEELKRLLKKVLGREESMGSAGRAEKIPVLNYAAEQKPNPVRSLECFDKIQTGRRMRKIYRRSGTGGRKST